MGRRDRAERLARAVLSAILAFGMVACASTLVASPTTPVAGVATDSPTAVPSSPTLTASPTSSLSQPSAPPTVTLRTLDRSAGEALLDLLGELINRLGPAGCRPGTRESDLEFGVPEKDLRKYLEGADGVEAMIGPRVWLGTLEGWARSLASAEVVRLANPASRYAFMILRVPADLDIALPVGTLAVIELKRLDAPAGVELPAGAEIWGLSWNLAYIQENCGKPSPT